MTENMESNLSVVRRLRRAAGVAVDGRVWIPSHARVLLRDVRERRTEERSSATDGECLTAASRWLARSQDASRDGGFAGRFSLTSGWSSSYPETTGYIVPTALALSREPGFESFWDRAERAIGFLLRVQLPNGAFPGGEIAENTSRPSIFNTAQILGGLVAWYRATGDGMVAEAAHRAAAWLGADLDADGAWRNNVYNGLPTTYTAHASCWLAEAGVELDVSAYRRAARQHLEWVLSHADRTTGWFDLAGFDDRQHAARTAFTHTIAYTLAGTLMTAELLDAPAGVRAVHRAADSIAQIQETLGWLPGTLDSQWRQRSNFACVTGDAQMALVWLRLYERGGEARFLAAATRAIETVKRAQVRHANGNVTGGIPGSDPLWGGYVPLAFPNWAAKFFIDALLAKRSVLTRVRIPSADQTTAT